MIPIIVFTSDKYLPALRAFAYLFNRYWSSYQPVRVVGFAAPPFALPPNFAFESLGDMVDYPVEKWSNALIDFLEKHPELEHFLFMLEDYWLTRPVNKEAVKMLYDYARQFRNVLKIDLVTDRLYAKGAYDYGYCGYIDMVASDYKSPYHFSLMAGIWSRELMLRFLIRDESPWDVEINGTPRVATAGNDVMVLGTRQAPLRHILAHRGGDSEKFMLSGLGVADAEELKKLGYI